MLRKEDYVKIKALKARGVYQKDIAAELGVHPKTVRRALERGSAPKGERPRPTSKLEPFKAQVDRLLAEGVWNAVVIWREVQAKGYTGSICPVRRYIAPKRTLRASRATVRFETEPGQQLQSDWGELVTTIAGQPTRVYFHVNTLGYSRRFHFWCTDCSDAEHTYEGLIRSLEYFGGAPGEVLVDNLKAAVVKHSRENGPHFTERFLDLAGWYGFTPRACRPYRARTKGKTERMVGYIKQHFFVRYRSFESWAHLNQLAEQWLREEADQRVHGTTGQVVAERFQQERLALKPLPRQRYDTAYREPRQVGWDGYVDVAGNRYTVPGEWAGQVVTVRRSLDGLIQIYAQERLLATHQQQPAEQGWVKVPEHQAVLWETTVQQRPLAEYAEVAQWS